MLTLGRVEVRRGGRMMMIVAATVLAVRAVLAARHGGLERTRREADDGGRVESGGRRVHVLVRAHLLAETCPTVAEPDLYTGLGQFRPEKRTENRFLVLKRSSKRFLSTKKNTKINVKEI